MTEPDRPEALQDHEFQTIVDIAAKTAGLAIPETKKSLVQSRITRRMRQVGVTDYGTYLASLENDRAEIDFFISALTTNVSHFFREKHHFDYLAANYLASFTAKKLRLWSAGCSNGQEPYSMAIEVLRNLPDAGTRDIQILATDIDPAVLERAKTGVYSAQETNGVSDADRRTYFRDLGDGRLQVSDNLKKLVTFRRLNLNGATWPMKGTFDVIFCRNVMIYFNDDTQRRLVARFASQLSPDGSLLLGHSERIQPLEGSGFRTDGITTYRKI